MTAPAPPDTDDPMRRRSRLFGVALLATVVVAALPLPWRLSGLGFAALAAYAGLRLLRDLATRRRAGRPANGWVSVTAGLGLAMFMVLLLGFQVPLYPLLAEQERCLARAVTHLDSDQCRAAFDRRREELLNRFGAP